jgi:hypothetical protein
VRINKRKQILAKSRLEYKNGQKRSAFFAICALSQHVDSGVLGPWCRNSCANLDQQLFSASLALADISITDEIGSLSDIDRTTRTTLGIMFNFL